MLVNAPRAAALISRMNVDWPDLFRPWAVSRNFRTSVQNAMALWVKYHWIQLSKQEDSMNGHPLSRRQVLSAAGGLTVAAAAGTACSGGGTDDAGSNSTTPPATSVAGAPSSTSASTGGSGGSGLLPTFTPFVPAKPDLVGDAEKGIPDGFLAYPASPPQVYSTPLVSGDPISVLKLTTDGVPPPLSQNKYWQELNKRIGVPMNVTNIITSDYAAKVATTVAGGNIPDLMQMQTTYLPNVQDFLTKECQDLSEWVSGDAVKQFKSLASLPTIAWKNVIFAGGVYAVPYPLGVVGSDTKVRQDIADQLGVGTEPSNGQEFMDMCKAFTDPAKKRWAMDQINTAQIIVNEALGVPNGWKVEDGKFTNAIATDEYKNGLDICNQLWKANCIYPDSLSSTADFHNWFTSGQVMIEHDGFTNWGVLTAAGLPANPEFKMGGIITPKWDGGGQAAHYNGSGIYTFTVMKKQGSKDDVARLLTVLDWFASPFGSADYLFKRYGIADRDYTLKGTDPVPTQTGTNEVQYFASGYIATSPVPLYVPGSPDVPQTQFKYLTQLMQVTTPLPTVGLVSATSLTKNSSLNKTLTDARADIVTGRKKVDTWDSVVKAWRANGGADIEKEYSEAYAAAGGQ
jgi:putative aldouronate transport system substrate-binding protein